MLRKVCVSRSAVILTLVPRSLAQDSRHFTFHYCFYGQESACGQEGSHLDSRRPVGCLSGSEDRFRQGRLSVEEKSRVEIWQSGLLRRDQPRQLSPKCISMWNTT